MQDFSIIEQLDIWKQSGQLDGIIEHWKDLLANPPAPDWVAGRLDAVATILNKRGIAVFAAGEIANALSYFTLVLRARPNDAAALNNAATCLKELGKLDESTATYRHALALQPTFAAAHSGILMNMHYKYGVTAAEMQAEHTAWDKAHALPLAREPHYRGIFDPNKQLKVGLVSADLGQHPVGHFLVRFLENIDRSQISFVGYVNGQRKDALADRLRNSMVEWHDTVAMNDDALTKKIEEDSIDILIDLSGHTDRNRLGVFARKPAPVQISWLGYPGESGLTAMDYVIGDRFVLPETMQRFMHAQIKHLPDNFVCFDPLEAPMPGRPPALSSDTITFGCFGNPAKCGAEVIETWAQILKRLPNARLLFKYKGYGEAACREDFIAQFAAHGVGASRLEFQGASKMPELFEVMQKVDIALDPFPFSGGMMSCLTLWMGLPLVTLPMESFASRQGLGFLTSIGMPQMIAIDRADYVEKAVKLAGDVPRLTEMRMKLRPAMETSPLCDGPRAGAALQNLLKEVWQEKCQTYGLPK